MNKVKISGLAALALLALPLFAHHGTGTSYDQKRVVTVKGVVKDFSWRNPHSALFIEGKDESGNVVTYALELGSPASLVSWGYTRNTFKPGDEAEVQMHPSFSNPTAGVCLENRAVINGKEHRFNNTDGKSEGN